MHYRKIKYFLHKVLPISIYHWILQIYRTVFLRFIVIYEKIRTLFFTKPQYKKVKLFDNYFYLYIDPSWWNDKEVYINWLYEKEIIKIIKKHIKKWDVFVDVGANLWIYTNSIPKLVGEQWKVIAFEPMLNIFERNQLSILKNWYKNVELHNIALSDKNWEEVLYINKNHHGASSFINKTWTVKENIKTTIGDQILSKEEQIDFIKIDVEWFEYHVLLWLENTIIKFLPDIILEFSPNLYVNWEWKKILSFLEKYYENIYLIEIWKKLNLTFEWDKKEYSALIDWDQINLYLSHRSTL